MESYIQQFSILAVPILLAVTFHEVAHGMVAYRLGDPTAKFGHMLRDARNGMGKLPVTYSVKEKAVNA